MRLISACAALVGILALGHQPASAASSLAGTIAEVFRFPAVMPLPAFDSLKPAILPGSPIFGMPARNESDVEAVDAGRIRTCNIPDPAAPIRRSTEGFLQRFVGAENIDELHLLFGLSEHDASNIDTYEVRLRKAVSLTAPIDDVEKEFRLGHERQILHRHAAGAAADGCSHRRCRSRGRVSRPATSFRWHRG